MKYYILGDTEIISLHCLTILNIVNILLLFFFYFVFLYNQEVYIRSSGIRNNGNRNNNSNNINRNYISYSFNFNDLYREALSDEFPDEEDKCSICLENFNFSINSNVIKTLFCNHYFHEQCILNWLRIKPKCPNCNANLVARIIEEED